MQQAKEKAPCTTAIVQDAKAELHKAHSQNTTYRRSYQDLIFSCTVYEVNKAREAFNAYMRENIHLLDAPGTLRMSKDVLLDCALAYVWKAAKLYFAEHCEACKKGGAAK